VLGIVEMDNPVSME